MLNYVTVGKLRTEVLNLPTNTKPSGTQVTKPRWALPIAGNWNTHITKKNLGKASSVLKAAAVASEMDNFTIGTNLSSDLNTPEIRLDDFAYNSKNLKREDSINMEGIFHEVELTDTNDCSTSGDCLATEAPSSIDKYSVCDMSPGTRDLLQADQLEESIDLTDFDYELGKDSMMSSMPIMLPQAMDKQYATWVAAPCNSPPQLSISEDDLNFCLPPEILEQMENLLPEELNLQNDEAQNSTNLDMYLGTHGGDILFGALEESGILNHELNTIGFQDHVNDMSITDVGATILPMDVQNTEEILYKQEESVNPILPEIYNMPLDHLNYEATSPGIPSLLEPSTYQQTLHPITEASACQQALHLVPGTSTSQQAINLVPGPSPSQPLLHLVSRPLTSQQALNLVPGPSTSQQTLHFVSGPSTSQQGFHPNLDVTPTRANKRQRRTSRKPLRFRDSELNNHLLQDVSSDEEIDIKRVKNTKVETIFTLKEEELEFVDEPSVSSRVSEIPTKDLTEEEKYHRIRILNNEASKRCRQKRKASLKEWENDLFVQQERNKKLKKKHDALLKLKDRLQPFVYKMIAQALASKK